jgi:hypothetical protein
MPPREMAKRMPNAYKRYSDGFGWRERFPFKRYGFLTARCLRRRHEIRSHASCQCARFVRLPVVMVRWRTKLAPQTGELLNQSASDFDIRLSHYAEH